MFCPLVSRSGFTEPVINPVASLHYSIEPGYMSIPDIIDKRSMHIEEKL